MKKVLLIGGAAIVAVLAFKHFSKSNGSNQGSSSRQAMIDELFVLHQHDFQNFAGKGLKKDIYDQFSDAEIAQIYNVDTYKVEVTPAYTAMLQQHGWA